MSGRGCHGGTWTGYIGVFGRAWVFLSLYFVVKILGPDQLVYIKV